MSKSRFFSTVIVAVILAVVVEILFGGWISARLATWPPLRRLNIYNPQAPIVVTNREIIRTSDSQDAVEAANGAKSRLSAVAMLQGNRLVVTGTAINLAADGYFVTAQSAFALKGATYFAVLNSGQSIPISGLFADPASNLMFFRLAANSVNVADFADSKGFLPGQKLVFLTAPLTSFSSGFKQSWVSTTQINTGGRVLSADRPSRSFGAQGAGTLLPGEVAITLDSEVAGLWDGSTFISANVLKHAVDLFFANNNQVRRPLFGFYYRMVTRAESTALNVPQGGLITKPDTTVSAVTPGSPAAAAGLQEGDYVVQIGDTKIDEGTFVEEALERVKPGDVVQFTIVRNKQSLILNLTAAELKAQ